MRQADSDSETAAVSVKCDLASDVLRSFGSLRFAATGWSMLPTLWPGDTLVVERAGRDQIQVGDVALVGRGGRLCAHRVVRRAEGSGNADWAPYWVTQGDAMSAPDQPVAESELLGRVRYIIRAGKCVAVPAELSVVEGLIARVVRRSVPAARALVFLHNMVSVSEGSVPERSGHARSGPRESVPCQG
jgi:hypothetical protein